MSIIFFVYFSTVIITIIIIVHLPTSKQQPRDSTCVVIGQKLCRIYLELIRRLTVFSSDTDHCGGVNS